MHACALVLLSDSSLPDATLFLFHLLDFHLSPHFLLDFILVELTPAVPDDRDKAGERGENTTSHGTLGLGSPAEYLRPWSIGFTLQVGRRVEADNVARGRNTLSRTLVEHIGWDLLRLLENVGSGDKDHGEALIHVPFNLQKWMPLEN